VEEDLHGVRLGLGRGPEAPHRHLAILGQIQGANGRTGLFREVEIDRQRFVQDEIAVLQRRDQPVRVDRKEARRLRVQGGAGTVRVHDAAGLDDGHLLERNAGLETKPDVARGARAGDAVEGDGHGSSGSLSGEA
jgi:hypothetical protein